MKWRRICQIAAKNLVSIGRNHRALASIVIPPLLAMAVYGYAYGATATDLNYLTPAIMGLLAMLIGFMPVTMLFASEHAIAERILTTPATEGELLCGQALSMSIVALLQSCTILGTTMLFPIRIDCSVFLALLVLLLLVISGQGLGFLVTSVSKAYLRTSMQFTPIVIPLSILPTGLVFPVEMSPVILRPVSCLILLTIVALAATSAVLKKRGWSRDEG
ncbi:MAG: ABC transporter permease [Thermoplasmata archaeon]